MRRRAYNPAGLSRSVTGGTSRTSPSYEVINISDIESSAKSTCCLHANPLHSHQVTATAALLSPDHISQDQRPLCPSMARAESNAAQTCPVPLSPSLPSSTSRSSIEQLASEPLRSLDPPPAPFSWFADSSKSTKDTLPLPPFAASF